MNAEVAVRIRSHVLTMVKQQKLIKQNVKLQKLLDNKALNKKEEKIKVVRALYFMVKAQAVDRAYMDRIAKYAKILASGLQLSPKYRNQIDDSFVEQLEVVAPIHDLGMIAIDKSIITKPGKLTTEEMSIVKQHTSYGIQPLSEMFKNDQENEYLKMAMEIAMYHHERYDGMGYPYGIVKQKIPLSARIISLVSIFDALTRETYYRPAYDKEQSLRIINAESGKMFDPEIIAVFNLIQNQFEIHE